VLDAVLAFDALVTAAPELATMFRPASIKLEHASVQAAKEQLAAELIRFRTTVEKTPLVSLCIDSVSQ